METPEMREKMTRPQKTIELVEDFEKREQLPRGEKLIFWGVPGKDVYNITAPFESRGTRYIAGRVEARAKELDSETAFFSEQKGEWSAAADIPTLRLEDPFITKITGDLVVGGVEIFPHPHLPNYKGFGWRTVFYRGPDIRTLKKFAVGPDMMKDIRLAALVDGKIGVFTRPQGGEARMGRIGFTVLDSLDELKAENIARAPLLESQFAEDEWGGVNQAQLLPDGTVAALGHIARRDPDGTKHYYAMTFTFNPHTRRASPIKIIATRKNFPAGPAKTPAHEDVIFPGGLIRAENGSAVLYTGLSDTEAGKIEIPDPFEA